MAINKKILAILLCGITAGAMLTSCGKEVEISEGEVSVSDATPAENVDIANYTAPNVGDEIIEMSIRGYGVVKIRLFPEYAAKGSENFIELAKSGYYDGLTYHRVIRDFMIQGGDPLGNGTGGESFWGGKFDGGTDPHLIHLPGALAYANSGETSTNGSQFYIVTGETVDDELFKLYEGYGITLTDTQKDAYRKAGGGVPFLDGNYTVFGQVIDGLDVIFNVQYTATNASDKPLNDVIIDYVKVVTYNGEPCKFLLSDYTYDDPTAKPVDNFTEPAVGDPIVCMDIKDYGTIKFRVFPELIPQGSENFLELAKQGYYDGLTYHRIIQDFMIQGGDPMGTGVGGESYWGGSFDGGKYYNLIHAAGAVAYANSGSTSTNGSQFYIVTGQKYDDASIDSLVTSRGLFVTADGREVYKTQGGAPFLDGSYTVFGQVIDGLDIVFKLQSVETDENDKPLTDVVIDKVTVEEYDGSPIRWYISDYDGSETPTEADAEEETSDTEETAPADTEETTEAAEDTTETEEAAAE